MSNPQGTKPVTEQAKEAISAAGQKAGEAWEATKTKVSEVRISLFCNMTLGVLNPHILHSQRLPPLHCTDVFCCLGSFAWGLNTPNID